MATTYKQRFSTKVRSNVIGYKPYFDHFDGCIDNDYEMELCYDPSMTDREDDLPMD